MVMPECRRPYFYSTIPLNYMRCINGSWDYVATCLPECGTLDRHTVPWHVSIYSKTVSPYKYICGSSLITESTVLSAAHCFGRTAGGIYPATDFAVAAGKQYQAWNDKRDENTVQRSDVQKLHVPVRYQGDPAYFQDDIAVVIVKMKFAFGTYVRPVCMDFDIAFMTRQLQAGHLGKMAGFNLPSENDTLSSPALKITERPYIDIGMCISNAPQYMRYLITSDKICAGAQASTEKNTAICRGNSGTGLAFPEIDISRYRYYLRGILSTTPETNGNSCNESTMLFTNLIRHEHFIREYLLGAGIEHASQTHCEQCD